MTNIRTRVIGRMASGELTRDGKTRMFEFGLTIRQKYDDYLGNSPRDVSVRSSALSRTLGERSVFYGRSLRTKRFLDLE